jgi:pimeloyl-ACP methyl ester carboxylesterase
MTFRPGPVRYVTVDDAQIAFQVSGEGNGIDFVYMLGSGSSFELWWDYPPFAKVLEHFASFGRLILFDRRGSGFSDALPAEQLPSWEHFAEDLDAVLDAADAERAVIMANFDGGPVAMVFAASNPERVRALILFNSFAKWFAADDYPIGAPPDTAGPMMDAVMGLWGTDELAKMIMPEEAENEAAVRWQARNLRAAATPHSYRRSYEQSINVDARPVLPLISVPTLVITRTDYYMVPAGTSKYIADNIAGAKYLEFPGSGSNIWGTASDEILDAIDEFVTGAKTPLRMDRVLATVLFTDIVGSTDRAAALGDRRWKELLKTHDETAASVLRSWDGTLVQTTGDGLLARFDGPGRAIHCARDMADALRKHDLEVRAGIHVGEIELREGDNIGGIAVHIAARVMSKAGAGEILCSRTVKDLTAGSDIGYEERGTHELKGVPDTWQLFAVAND